MDMINVGRALISVADKRGVGKFAGQLAGLGIEILSTGGTADELRSAGVPVQDVAERTGFGAAFSGRVKTLHPAIMGAILADRSNPDHAADAEQFNAEPIDLVVVNFYRFADALASGASAADLVEKIDIGGPTMVRAAAKNHAHVLVVVNPHDYRSVVEELARNDGKIERKFAARLAAKAFAHTAEYDRMIGAALAGAGKEEKFPPPEMDVALRRVSRLRYGENPHQAAALYAMAGNEFKLLAGSEVSYNNVQDAIAAWRSVREFDETACSIVKHANPCGIAGAERAADAFAGAFAANPESAFGGVVAINRQLDAATATAIADHFIEVLIVPGATPEALEALAGRRRLRIIEAPLAQSADFDVRVYGGLGLVQERDSKVIDSAQLRELAGSAIDEQQLAQLLFAWRACKHAKSNAIVLVRQAATIGIGAGQTSRVEAARQAIEQARRHGDGAGGAVAASDGFLPFPDTVEILAKAGVKALVQPGGSKRDDQVVAAAKAAGIAMVMTGVRHFIH